MKPHNSWLLFMLILFSSCGVLRPTWVNHKIKKDILKNEVFDDHFTGFILYDPNQEENLVEINSNHFFTPASNVKLITYYGSLISLQDSIPGIRYELKNDTLYFSGTGDPTFLAPEFENQPVFDFLLSSQYPLVYVPAGFTDTPFAPGWSWEDYEYYFQTERNELPIYGNAVHYIYDSIQHTFSLSPSFFTHFASTVSDSLRSQTILPARDYQNNIFNYLPNPERSAYKNRVPFKTSLELSLALLSDTLNREVGLSKKFIFDNPETVYSQRSKFLCELMLKRSDNHIAEQLPYLSSYQLGLTLSFESFKAYVIQHGLHSISEQLVWRDGSGLSRYNLVTPQFMIELMKLILKDESMEEFKSVLPTGGIDGTLRKYYTVQKHEKPYIFAKTGTLSNIHNLSGVIQTKSGKELLFCFMNNNYIGGSARVKVQMEETLKYIRDHY